mgnify:CR=1 FL=1
MENKIEARHLNLYYGQKHALKDVNLDIKENKITAFIGPSGCGKSTFLKTLNRMNDYVDNVKIEGDVILDGEDIYDSRVDTTLLRKKVGMVFQQPNPFPMSIYDNVAYGPRIHGIKNKKQLDKIVEDSLKAAALYDEVSDRLHSSALGLSGGQQQRLCIARALAASPDILLMDEPFGAVDEITRGQLQTEIKRIHEQTGITVLFVTHDISEALKLGTKVLVMNNGKIEQFAKPENLLRSPATEFVKELVKKERRTCYLPEEQLASCEFSGAANEIGNYDTK